MSDVNFAGLEEELNQTESGVLGRVAWLFLRLFVFTLSAVTTFAFFMRYVGDAFVGLVGADLSPYLSGLAGLLALDVAAQIWGHMRSSHADTVAQMATAGAMGVIDLSLSVAVTAVYLFLATSLDAGVRDPAGNLTQLGLALNYAGVFIIVASVSLNFIAAYAYGQVGMNTRKAAQQRKLTATVNAGRYTADAARADLVTRQTLAHILAQLPDLAQQQGHTAGSTYLAHTMNGAAVPPKSGVIKPEHSLMAQTDSSHVRFVAGEDQGAGLELPTSSRNGDRHPFAAQ